MIDIVKLLLKAGDGGNGRVSFRREKYVPKGGPDGGDGGKGGSLIIEAESGMATLAHFAGKTEFEAQRGEVGGKRNKIGSKGEDLVLKVPIGTIVWLVGENEISRKGRMFSSHFRRKMSQYELEAEGSRMPAREKDSVRAIQLAEQKNEDEINFEQFVASTNLNDIDIDNIAKIKLFEFKDPQDRLIIAKGGKGGRGNQRFASSTLQVPLVAEYGEFGEQKLVILEQKLLADVGLVGFPNAGKSTLISVVTSARPKIASYPFTTLEPNLGVMKKDDREIVIADIPGLIEGASEGKGLGHAFLRHVENSRALAFILSLDEAVVFDHDLNDDQKADQVYLQYQALQKELQNHRETLADKHQVIFINKADLYNDELKQAIEKRFKAEKLSVSFLSALTHQGLGQFYDQLEKLV